MVWFAGYFVFCFCGYFAWGFCVTGVVFVLGWLLCFMFNLVFVCSWCLLWLLMFVVGLLAVCCVV